MSLLLLPDLGKCIDCEATTANIYEKSHDETNHAIQKSASLQLYMDERALTIAICRLYLDPGVSSTRTSSMES